MKTKFITDLEKATLQAKREFNADVSLVWRAWTEAEILDQWWAPKPWKCETTSMDFKRGGKWVYRMVGPNGESHGAVQIYDQIEVRKFFSGKDAFADNDGNINEDLPVATWKNTFTPTATGTVVTIFAEYPDKESLETVLKMGMQEGLNIAQDGLDELLEKLKKEAVA